MGYNTVKKKNNKLSFIERAQYIPKTYRYLESFFVNMNNVYDL
jgi:hypothetical protein